jgi:hypothetical protein
MNVLNKCLIPVAALAIAAAPLAAGAADTAPGSNVLVCRPATAGEKPVAMMGTTSLICKPLAVILKQADGTMKRMGNPKAANPVTCDSMKGLTVEQQDAAMNKCVNKVFDSVNGNS